MTTDNTFADEMAGLNEGSSTASRCANGNSEAATVHALRAIAHAIGALAIATRDGLADLELAGSKMAVAHERLAKSVECVTDAIESIAASPRLK